MKNKRIHYLYQITNLKNGMIYIGVHTSNNIINSYMGSGTNIIKAIQKEGKENFKKEILEIFKSPKKCLAREKEIVNKDFIKRKDTYNIILGGGKLNALDCVTVRDKFGNTFMVNKYDPKYLSGELKHMNVGSHLGEFVVKDKKGRKFKVHKNDPRYLSGELVSIRKDVKFSIEHKEKLKQKAKLRKGEKNNSFGTFWINDKNSNKRIKFNELEKYLKLGWIKGRIYIRTKPGKPLTEQHKAKLRKPHKLNKNVKQKSKL